MAKVITDDQHYKDIAAAIRGKLNVEETYKPEEMAGAIGGIETAKNEDIIITANGEYLPSEGFTGFGKVVADVAIDTTIEDGLITGTLTSYTNDRVESVKSYAFYENVNLQQASLPNCKAVDRYAFAACTNLTSVNLPQVETINERGFYNNKKLAEIVMPKVKTIRPYALYYSAIKSVDAPMLTDISSNAFENCKSLTDVRIPALARTNTQIFYGCTALQTADIGKVETNMFSNCPKFTTLILRSATLVNLTSTNTFTKTPFAIGGTGGVCLVPTAIVESYETATNWSALYAAGTCTFLPLEEYTLDGTTTGEIDMAKVEAKLNELYGGAEA